MRQAAPNLASSQPHIQNPPPHSATPVVGGRMLHSIRAQPVVRSTRVATGIVVPFILQQNLPPTKRRFKYSIFSIRQLALLQFLPQDIPPPRIHHGGQRGPQPRRDSRRKGTDSCSLVQYAASELTFHRRRTTALATAAEALLGDANNAIAKNILVMALKRYGQVCVFLERSLNSPTRLNDPPSSSRSISDSSQLPARAEHLVADRERFLSIARA